MADFDEYPNGAGHRGVDTSIAAADVINKALPKLQGEVYRTIISAGSRGMTGDEVAAALDWEKWRVRPRTSELRRQLRIIDSGQRRRSDSGIAAIVWIDANLEDREVPQ